MKLQEIALIGNMRNDAYNAGYAAAYRKATDGITSTEIKLRNEINSLYKRCSWWQNKHTKAVENYENCICNLKERIALLQKTEENNEHESVQDTFD